MFSNQDNIRNPMRIPDYLNLHPVVESWKCPRVQIVTQEEYDLIKTHEPNTMYYIKDSKKPTVYMGEHLIPQEEISCKYMMGPRNINGNYTLYMVIMNDGRYDVVKIAETPNINIAIRLLDEWGKTGYHDGTRSIIRQGLVSYINRTNSAHEFIVNIICMFGYRNDPRLNDVINVMTTMGSTTCRKFQPFASEQLEYLKNHPHNSLFKRYSDLYDLLVEYDYFDGPQYQKDSIDLDTIDLTEQIDEIERIMMA